MYVLVPSSSSAENRVVARFDVLSPPTRVQRRERKQLSHKKVLACRSLNARSLSVRTGVGTAVVPPLHKHLQLQQHSPPLARAGNVPRLDHANAL